MALRLNLEDAQPGRTVTEFAHVMSHPWFKKWATKHFGDWTSARMTVMWIKLAQQLQQAYREQHGADPSGQQLAAALDKALGQGKYRRQVVQAMEQFERSAEISDNRTLAGHLVSWAADAGQTSSHGASDRHHPDSDHDLPLKGQRPGGQLQPVHPDGQDGPPRD